MANSFTKISVKKKSIIFVDKKAEAEEVIASMKQLAEARQEPNIFYVHHGSLSAELRQETEAKLKNSSGPIMAAATSTLELGIDIGDLDSVIQLGAPSACSSFVQRLGRSGRRTGKAQMMFINFHLPKENSSIFDLIPWDLLQTIAVIQLYLENQWVEPFELKAKPFSLLAHQTLSVLMAYGELSFTDLVDKVLSLPPFEAITTKEYDQLIKHMIFQGYLQKIEQGGIIVGIKGEKITNYFSFYAVFKSGEVFHVFNQEKELGTLDCLPIIGEVFILGGRVWKVQAINEEQKIIKVVPANKANTSFWSRSSEKQVHTKIVEKMKQILSKDVPYSYLHPNALHLLEQARQLARSNELLKRLIIPISSNSFYLFPWTGTKKLYTIKSILNSSIKKEKLEISSVQCLEYALKITGDLSPQEFVEKMAGINSWVNDDFKSAMVADCELRVDKFDKMVPEALLKEACFYNQMDLPGAIEVLENLKL